MILSIAGLGHGFMKGRDCEPRILRRRHISFQRPRPPSEMHSQAIALFRAFKAFRAKVIILDDKGRKWLPWRRGLGLYPMRWLRTDLQTLVLADNGLTEVSERGDLQASMLDLGHDRLRSCEILGTFEDLSDFLYLHDNRLAHFPIRKPPPTFALPQHQRERVRGFSRGRHHHAESH